jgi:hypothetical protein
VFISVLNSLPGRLLRFIAGFAIATWGFTFGVPAALVVQTIGITMAVFALADICVLRAPGVQPRAAAATVAGKARLSERVEG